MMFPSAIINTQMKTPDKFKLLIIIIFRDEHTCKWSVKSNVFDGKRLAAAEPLDSSEAHYNRILA